MMRELVRIAVWNICGPPGGKNMSETEKKIRVFTERTAEAPAAAFFLEAPPASALSGIDPDRCRWVAAEAGNPRGILFVRNDPDLEIRFPDPPSARPKWEKTERSGKEIGGRTALGVEIRHRKSGGKFRILAVWTTPKCDGKRQDIYFKVLDNILTAWKDAGFFADRDIPCIVAGDTNVILSAGTRRDRVELTETSCGDPAAIAYLAEAFGNVPETVETMAKDCRANRRKLARLTEECGLTMPLDLAGPRLPAGSVPPWNTLRKTRQGKDSWLRCDFLMISQGHRDRLEAAYLGERKYDDCGSDHCPIVFGIRV